MRRLLMCLCLVLSACGPPSSGPTTTQQTTSTAPPSSTSTSSPPTAIGCPLDAEFVGTGRIGRVTQPSSDSKTLGLISRHVVDACETFGFDFETDENAPATTPPSIDAEFLDGGGVVRIHLNITSTVITDQVVETDLVERLFVVRALDGTMFVDLHLAKAANARITVSNSPARLALELTPRDGEIGPRAAFDESVVVLTPAADTAVDQEFAVDGYARLFEANVLVIATSGEVVLASENATAADWLETWGEFSTELSVAPGNINLFVGEESPADGSLDGVILNLTVR